MDPGPANFLKFTVDSQQQFSQGWPKSVTEHTFIYVLCFVCLPGVCYGNTFTWLNKRGNDWKLYARIFLVCQQLHQILHMGTLYMPIDELQKYDRVNENIVSAPLFLVEKMKVCVTISKLRACNHGLLHIFVAFAAVWNNKFAASVTHSSCAHLSRPSFRVLRAH